MGAKAADNGELKFAHATAPRIIGIIWNFELAIDSGFDNGILNLEF